MRNRRRIGAAVVLTVAIFFATTAGAQQIQGKDCFFLESLHYSAAGMEYWYSAANGGLERLTGIPYDQLTCKNCHTPGCDRCHKVESTEKDCTVYEYTVGAATNQAMCLKCHGRERAMMRIDHKAGQEDVHVQMGMECSDCHSAREMHGDGTPYISLKQEGAMDTRCENCHDELKPVEAHVVHEDHLDCKACHLRHVVSCTNCHFDTLLKEGVRKARPVAGWVFLMNLRGKVTAASMQTFVVGEDKTFLMFAPHMSHSVMNPGRGCDDCHDSENVHQVQKGNLKLTWLEDGELHNRKGVIPVVDGVDYQCSYEHFADDKWTPVKNPRKPLLQYVAFGEPLTAKQLDQMAAKQSPPPPKME